MRHNFRCETINALRHDNVRAGNGIKRSVIEFGKGLRRDGHTDPRLA